MPGEAASEKNCKLFVGGITFNTTDEVLSDFYSQWGKLIDWKAMKDQTGRPRGFGFVTYESPDMLETAMSNRPHVIDGKQVDPKRAIPREMSDGNHNNQGSIKRIYVGNIMNKSIDQDALREYFSSFGTIEQVDIPLDKETGKLRGFAFIIFDDYDAVDKAILAGTNHTIGGHSVLVKKGIDKNQQNNRGQMGRDRGARMGRSRGTDRQYGGRGGYGGGYESGWGGKGGSNGGFMGGYGGGYPQAYNTGYPYPQQVGGGGWNQSGGGGGGSWGGSDHYGGGWGGASSNGWAQPQQGGGGGWPQQPQQQWK